MFKKHKRLVIAIVLGAIVLCIGGKIGMDYKKDYDWQQEKNRQLEVSKGLKNEYGNLSKIEFEDESKVAGSGVRHFWVKIIQDNREIKINGIAYYSDGRIGMGYFNPGEVIPKSGKSLKDVKVIFSDKSEALV